MKVTSLYCMAICFVLVLAFSSAAFCWPVTEVYVKVSQDENGVMTTTTNRPDLWTGPKATWRRAVERGKYDGCYRSNDVVAKIVGMAPPTTLDSFYGVAPMGGDAYYMETHYSDCGTVPMNKVYIGTDFFSDRAITDILTLKYSTQVRYRAYYGQSHTFAGQPPMIELITDSGSSTQQRVFWYKPWGEFGTTNAMLNTWQEWDCLASGGYWEQFRISSTTAKGDWAWLRERYSTNKYLRTPLVGDYMEGGVWDGGIYKEHNNTGTSLCIKQGCGFPWFDKNQSIAWWTETCDVHSFVDKLVIGFADGWQNGVPTGETRYIFDFENRIEPVRVLGALTHKASWNPPVQSMQDSNLFVVFGKVTTADYVPGFTFSIDDGSRYRIDEYGATVPVPIKVIAWGHDIPMPSEFDNWFVRVEGRIAHTATQTVIYSRPDLIHLYE